MSAARHEIEGMAAVPDTSEQWSARLAGPHPPHISRVAGALLTWTSSRSQAYMVAYTLADAGLLAHDFAPTGGGSDPTPTRQVDVVLEFSEGDMEYDGPVRDQYGCRWLPAVRPGDGFRGWAHRLPGSNLAPVWQTWGQLTIQRGPLTAVDADRLDIPAARR